MADFNHVTAGRKVWAVIQAERKGVAWLKGYSFIRHYRKEQRRVSRAMYQHLKAANG
jgi:hypothetical protein